MSTVAAPSASAWTEEGIYQRMVQTIRNQQLHPGTKLGEDRLASAFGVSRTRIRPVLARLASEQVVTITPNRGATVARPTEQEAREVFQVRRLIEPTLVAAFMARASSAELLTLGHCITHEEAARSQGERHRAIRLAGEFHLHIAQFSQHQTLGRIMGELVSRTSLVLMAYGQPAEMGHGPGIQHRVRRHGKAGFASNIGGAKARGHHVHLRQVPNGVLRVAQHQRAHTG